MKTPIYHNIVISCTMQAVERIGPEPQRFKCQSWQYSTRFGATACSKTDWGSQFCRTRSERPHSFANVKWTASRRTSKLVSETWSRPALTNSDRGVFTLCQLLLQLVQLRLHASGQHPIKSDQNGQPGTWMNPIIRFLLALYIFTLCAKSLVLHSRSCVFQNTLDFWFNKYKGTKKKVQGTKMKQQRKFNWI